MLMFSFFELSSVLGHLFLSSHLLFTDHIHPYKLDDNQPFPLNKQFCFLNLSLDLMALFSEWSRVIGH